MLLHGDTAHLLGLGIHHFVHSPVSAVQTIIDVLRLRVSNAAETFDYWCLRRRTLGARRVLAVIPSCNALLFEVARFPAHVEVERTRRDGGDSLAMMDDSSSRFQCIAVARILGIAL